MKSKFTASCLSDYDVFRLWPSLAVNHAVVLFEHQQAPSVPASRNCVSDAPAVHNTSCTWKIIIKRRKYNAGQNLQSCLTKLSQASGMKISRTILWLLPYRLYLFQLEETIFVANFFSQSTWSDDQRLENSSVVASSQRTNFIFDEEMKVLFLSFQNEIFKLIDWVASVDSMLCIPMLGHKLFFFHFFLFRLLNLYMCRCNWTSSKFVWCVWYPTLRDVNSLPGKHYLSLSFSTYFS